MTDQPPRSALSSVGLCALSLSAFLIGRWLIGHGFVLTGGGAVFIGAVVLSSLLKPPRLSEGFLAIFWASWTGLGAFVMLQQGRYFSFLPVLFLFSLGIGRVRHLFAKRAPKAPPAASTVIEGQVTATREEPPKPIHSEESR